MSNKRLLIGGVMLAAMTLGACGKDAGPSAGSVDSASELIAKAAKKYDENVSAADLVSEAGLKGSDKLTNAAAAQLLYGAFKDSIPEHIGARRLQANLVKFSDFTDVKDGDSYVDALKFLIERGVYVPSVTNKFQPNSGMTTAELKVYLDRFHAYYGASEVDDFYSTVNAEYLFENPEWKDPTPGLIDTDGDGEYDGEYIYDSALIPQSGTNDWARRLMEASKTAGKPNISAFASTYYDTSTRTAAVAGGLSEFVNQILAAKSLRTFNNVLQRALNNWGWSPLFTSYEVSLYTITPKVGDPYDAWQGMAECYDITTPLAELTRGSKRYQETIDTFTPLFASSFGVSADQSAKLAKDLAEFRLEFATQRKSIVNSNPDSETTGFYPGKTEYFGVPDATDPTGFSLYNMLKNAGVKDPECFNWSTFAPIQSILNIWNNEHLDLLKAFVVQQLGSRYYFCLPDDAVEGWFKVPGHSTSLEGLDDVDTFAEGVMPYLKDELCKYYLESDEYAQNYSAAKALLGELKSNFAKRIDGESWLSSAGKKAAKEKLAAMGSNLGMTYGTDNEVKGTLADLDVFTDATFVSKEDGGTLWQNIGIYDNARFDKFGAMVGDKYKGGFTFETYLKVSDPMEANAFYIPSLNQICITMGYMSSYRPIAEMSMEEKLACYGWVVGHEMSHGFDANGVQYNASGEMQDDWWSVKDQKAYDKRTEAMIKFYDGVEVMPGQKTPGKTVITEAVADVTGINVCLDIASKTQGFNYKDFFTRAAQNFGAVTTQYIYVNGGLAGDEHPFGRARVNRCFQTLDKFYSTVGIKEGDNMYVAPKDRPAVW